MQKTNKLKLARETVVMLSQMSLRQVQGGAVIGPSARPVACEPSGVIACPPEA